MCPKLKLFRSYFLLIFRSVLQIMIFAGLGYFALPNRSSSLSINCLCLQIAGLLPPSRQPFLWFLFSAFSWWAFFCQASLIPAELAALYQHWGDLNSITLNVCIMITMMAGAFKFLLFIRKLPETCDMINELDAIIDREKDKADKSGAEKIKRIFESSSWNARWKSVCFLVNAFITDTTWNILPMVYMSIDDTAGKLLPNVSWYPFEVSESPVYEVIYFMQTFSTLHCAIGVISTDMLFISIMIHIRALLQVLCVLLADIRLEEPVNHQDNDQVKDDENHHEKMYEDLRQCIILHQDIIRSSKKLESILNGMLLPQFLSAISTICLTLFQASTNANDTATKCKFMMYLLVMMMSVLLYCWYGQCLIQESEQVRLAAYSCGWPDASPKFKRALRLVMTRAQKPLTLTAGKMHRMSMDTFVTIINASYTYYAVLRQVNDRNK